MMFRQSATSAGRNCRCLMRRVQGCSTGEALNVRHLPQFGLFVQGAYGNPGLDMLKNEFSPYYMAGVRLSWNFGSLYTLKNDRRVIEKKRQQLDNNRDVFLFNTRLEMTQQDQAIRSLEKQMRDDDEIIRLRTNSESC